MPVDTISIRICFRDAKGQVRCLTINFGAASIGAGTVDGVTTLVGLLQAVSNASVGSAYLGNSFLPYGTASTYLSVADKAQLFFQDPNGNRTVIGIPAPKASIFLADGETVDATNTDVAALITYMQSHPVSRTGGALTFISGSRLRRKAPRRINAYTLNPELTAPEGP